MIDYFFFSRLRNDSILKEDVVQLIKTENKQGGDVKIDDNLSRYRHTRKYMYEFYNTICYRNNKQNKNKVYENFCS